MLGAVPGVIGAFKRVVPEDYWSRDTDTEDGHPVAIVACPCGEEPPVRLAGTKTCNCGRAFFYIGEEVRVAFGPRADS